MTDDRHAAERERLGAYALGHLDAAEAAAVEAHLRGCGPCRAELAGVAPVARLLHTAARPEPGPVTVPAGLGERITAAVGEERRLVAARRRSQRVSAFVAAAAAVVVVAGAGAVAGRSGAPRVAPGPAVPVEAVAVRSAVPGIEASAGVVPHTWGVEIKLHAAGFDPGAAYSVHVVTRDGRRRTAGAFVGTGARRMDCNLNSDVLRPDARSFAVVDAAGRTVLTGSLADVPG